MDPRIPRLKFDSYLQLIRTGNLDEVQSALIYAGLSGFPITEIESALKEGKRAYYDRNLESLRGALRLETHLTALAVQEGYHPGELHMAIERISTIEKESCSARRVSSGRATNSN